MMTDRESLTRLILQRLDDQDDSIRLQWAHPAGTPTRHFVVDELLPVEIAQTIHDKFPRDANGFFHRDSFREKKKTSANLADYAPLLGDITYALQDKRVVDKVSALIGAEAIEPDPTLYAGGLSMMFSGDFLNPHIDNSHDARRDRYRRLNLLYYVSPDWTLANGGNFELWNAERKVPKTIVAAFNRLVVMETARTSWHSVSPVVADRPRCCVSNYYFSKISPDKSTYFHVTSFYGRPEQPARRLLGVVDNALRNWVSKTLKIGRGRHLINKTKH